MPARAAPPRPWGWWYWLLGLVCALAIGQWASSPAAPYPSQGQTELARASGIVYGHERLGQLVEVPHEGLAAVQFWLLAHRRDADGDVVLRIAAPAAPDQDLARVAIPLRDLPSAPPVTFALPVFDQVANPVLMLTLEAPTLDRSHALSVLGGDNRYSGGLLLVNGRPRPGEDLAFQLLAPRYQGDRLLPFTPLWLGRPGLFGQPLLYAMLLWSVLWGYGWVLFCVLRYTLALRRAPRPGA